MAILVVVRSRRAADDGVVLRFGRYVEALRFAAEWDRRHRADRVCIFGDGLEPLLALDGQADPREESAQSGSRAS